MQQANILLLYTGGTIGMMEEAATGLLKPFDFKFLLEHVPELKRLNINISSLSFEKPIDSSDMNPAIWAQIATLIEENYERYEGFVILHGSDTMAYTASALSFMLENLAKPVILTGSQLPIGTIRTDGKENLITALEIAAARKDGKPIVPEVAIYFEYQLYRGNRTHKFNAEHFQAFQSANYPVLAEAGLHIRYNYNAIMPANDKSLKVLTNMETNVAILKIFPGMSDNVLEAVLNIHGLKGFIIETFGSGNASVTPRMRELLFNAIQQGMVVLNISQCNSGRVEQGRYATSATFNELGVIGGSDLTTEAAVTKLMYLLGQQITPEEIKILLAVSLRGEMTI